MFKYELLSKGIEEKIINDRKNNTGPNLGFDNDDVIPNDAFIVTMFDGDKIDSIGLQLFFDINGDSKVTAADARLALRAAAKLEKLNTIQIYAADIDGREGITAADARLILRKAAKID